MKVSKLHEDEVDIDVELIRQLLASQSEELSGLELKPITPVGTDNVIYRVGEKHLVRLPRKEDSGLKKELKWLPYLSSKLALDTPLPYARGKPNSNYPFVWAVYNWLDGEAFEADKIGHKVEVGNMLAQFVLELRAVDPSQGPRSNRDSILNKDDPTVLSAIDSLDGTFDKDAVSYVWEALSTSDRWKGDGVWIHGDLLPGNLLVRNEQISAVIDFGLIGVGDPAVDLIPAWGTLRGKARTEFRSVLDPDDHTWKRAQGFALRQALRIIPYYRESNPSFTHMACRTVEEILDDFLKK